MHFSTQKTTIFMCFVSLRTHYLKKSLRSVLGDPLKTIRRGTLKYSFKKGGTHR